MTAPIPLQIEPTYLRYIFDSLELNALHKDNISALPEGLIGMYEEAFSNEQNVRSRERFLKFFTAWSLLKKEVSTSLMADLLDWEEWEVNDFISIYTKWFNSPESGKYLLYHERLRVFFLEKISSHQLDQINQIIISKCQLALEQRNGDEWEVYALEHLPSHLLIAAMQSEADGVVFKKLVYDTSFWNRQLEISKGYEWSKRMLNQTMSWAAKKNTDELIECALNKIDLHYMEQNDAPRIVELVAQNDIETALLRIESFGGNDKEGLQRKFILYMLCLIELTLLDSKDKPFRRDAIEKILKHFDENMPVDYSVLNWDEFFSSYLVFIIACNLNELSFDGQILFKRTRSWDNNWIEEKSPYSDLQIKTLIKCAGYFIHEKDHISTIVQISIELLKNNQKKESESLLKQAHKISKKITDIKSMIAVSNEYYLRENYQKSDVIMIEVKLIADSIKYPLIKSDILSEISIAYARKGKADEAFKILNLINERSNRERYDKVKAAKEIVISLVGLGRQKEALELLKTFDFDTIKFETLQEVLWIEIDNSNSPHLELIIKQVFDAALDISDELLKISSLAKLSTQFTYLEETEMSKKCMYEAFKVIKQITNKPGFYGDTNKGYKQIAIEFAKQRKFEKALKNISKITDNECKILALIKVSEELYFNGKLDEKELIKDSLIIISKIKDNNDKNKLLSDLSIGLADMGEINQSIVNVANISDQFKKNQTIKKLCSGLILKNKFNYIVKLFQEAIEIKPAQNDKSFKLNEIAFELINQGKLKDAIYVAQEISEKDERFDALIKIYTELIKKGKLDDALVATICIDIDWQIGVVLNLSMEYYKIKKYSKSNGLMLECINNVELYNWEFDKNLAYKDISVHFAKQGKFKNATEIVNNKIQETNIKDLAFSEISIELIRRGKLTKARKLHQQCYIKFDDNALSVIAVELAKGGDFEEAVQISQDIIDTVIKISALIYISIEIIKKSIGKSIVEQLVHLVLIVIENDLNNKKVFQLLMKEVLGNQNKVYVSVILKEIHDRIGLIIKDEIRCKNLIELSKVYFSYGYKKTAFELLNEAIELAYLIEGQKKIYQLLEASIELLNFGYEKMSSALLDKVLDLSIFSGNNASIASTTLEFANRGQWRKAESAGLYISSDFIYRECWYDIAKRNLYKNGVDHAFQVGLNLISKESRVFYFRALVDSVNAKDVDFRFLYKLICKNLNDAIYLETLLQKYSLNMLFYSNSFTNKINRLNRTLNIQWAIDITNNINKN